ncbi:MAG TPA: hypothetical protein VFP50_07845 [Anaeromyxobacteraceae bacterium]|nr:hypothetical protein [Anaeromyxobacteraceae bacterium]
MTYKIDANFAADGYRLEVHGLVDLTALVGIRGAIRVGRAGQAGKLRLVLKEGCQVEPAAMDELRRLDGVELIAESPFLARWLGGIR